MAQDLGMDFAAGPAVSGLFGTAITAGTSQTSSAIDLGAVAPGEVGLEIKIVTGTGTPAGNKLWKVSAKWSHDNIDFTDDDLAAEIASATIAASATDIIIVTIPTLARYLKLLVDNDQSTGPDIATTSAIALTDVFGDQV